MNEVLRVVNERALDATPSPPSSADGLAELVQLVDEASSAARSRRTCSPNNARGAARSRCKSWSAAGAW